LAVVVAVMATVGNLAWAVAGWAVAAGVSLGLYTLPSAWRLAREEDGGRKGTQTSNAAQGLRPRGELRRLTRLTWVALPLGVVTMLISFQVNVPRYYLEAYRGESELGIYTALAHLPAAGNLVMQALGQAASPRLARHHAAGERGAFRRLLLQLLGIGFLFEAIGLLLVVLLGATLLRLLYTPEYAEHVELLGLLTVASAISCLAYFVSYAMTAARIFRAQVPLFIAMVLATAAGCQLWVPEYGMRGAAWAAIAAAGVQFVGSALLCCVGGPQWSRGETA
jgi:O-antigen/teichoic acid export membrane protein